MAEVPLRRLEGSSDAGSAPRAARLADYVSLARPSHWVKHIFIVPGVVLALLLQRRALADCRVAVFTGFVSAALLASANYVLNEWLDQQFDRHHPEKRHRAAAAMRLSRWIVLAEYVGLIVAGMALALRVSTLFAVVATLFLASGVVYNVSPLRTKDHPYLDVLTESFNNPLRLTLGWAMVETSALPPASLLLGYWMGGAFLMTVKRLAEFRTIVSVSGREELQSYRRSFRGYGERSLLVTALVYALLSSFFIGVFVIKYRIEYLLALPLMVVLFGVYLRIGLEERSPAQAPERLFMEWRLLLTGGALIVLLAILTVVDIPALQRLVEPHYIELEFERGD